MESNKDYIIRQLNSGKTIWRYTTAAAISYTKTAKGVLVVRHNDLGSCKDETISMATAAARLVRNFKQISAVR